MLAVIAIGISSISKIIPEILRNENLKNSKIISTSKEESTKVSANPSSAKLETSNSNGLAPKSNIEQQLNSNQEIKNDKEAIQSIITEQPKTEPAEISKVEAKKIEEEIKQKTGEIVNLDDGQIKEDIKEIKNEIQQNIIDQLAHVESQIEKGLDNNLTIQESSN